ncbi:hypothetical protein D3C87_2018460 [compost metagenome]
MPAVEVPELPLKRLAIQLKALLKKLTMPVKIVDRALLITWTSALGCVWGSWGATVVVC